jgi:multiple sugar transport system ATP-binding protein
MATITLKGVKKVYPNGFEAVHAVDLIIDEGEFMVLVGPSGCGKTTILRMVAGLEDISDGEVLIGGRVVNDLGPKERDVAMVFQNYALYPHMTVAQNIGFALKLRKMSKTEIAAKVKEAGAILGLTDWLDRKPGQLSGGQRQRVAMGRAIVREPSVFLMDEPLSNLDAKLRVLMRAEVTRIQRRLGVATVYVTHDQTEAMTMGDRVAVLSAGDLQQCDKPQTLYDTPANLFVAGFMGSPAMNTYEGSLADDLSSVRIGSQSLALPESVRGAHRGLQAYVGRRLVVGIRPENLTIGEDGDPRPVLQGDVSLVEPLGSELMVHFTIDAKRVVAQGAVAEDDDDPTTALTEGVARVDVMAPVRQGDRARFSVDVNRMQFFDPETGLAIWN